MLNIITNTYVLPFITKPKLAISSSDSLKIQGPSESLSPGLFSSVSFVKKRNRKGGKCKSSRVLQLPVSSPQASPKM